MSKTVQEVNARSFKETERSGEPKAYCRELIIPQKSSNQSIGDFCLIEKGYLPDFYVWGKKFKAQCEDSGPGRNKKNLIEKVCLDSSSTASNGFVKMRLEMSEVHSGAIVELADDSIWIVLSKQFDAETLKHRGAALRSLSR